MNLLLKHEIILQKRVSRNIYADHCSRRLCSASERHVARNGSSLHCPAQLGHPLTGWHSWHPKPQDISYFSLASSIYCVHRDKCMCIRRAKHDCHIFFYDTLLPMWRTSFERKPYLPVLLSINNLSLGPPWIVSTLPLHSNLTCAMCVRWFYPVPIGQRVGFNII